MSHGHHDTGHGHREDSYNVDRHHVVDSHVDRDRHMDRDGHSPRSLEGDKTPGRDFQDYMYGRGQMADGRQSDSYQSSRWQMMDGKHSRWQMSDDRMATWPRNGWQDWGYQMGDGRYGYGMDGWQDGRWGWQDGSRYFDQYIHRWQMADPYVRQEERFQVYPAKSVYNQFREFVIPQNPGMADNNFSCGHQDSWCSETVNLSGPTRENLSIIRKKNPYGYMPYMGTNKRGQMIGMCVKDDIIRCIVYDEDCNILSATHVGTCERRPFDGGYFYMDDNDDAVMIANNRIKCLPTRDVRDDCSSIIDLEFKWVSENINDMVCEKLEQDNRHNRLYAHFPAWVGERRDDRKDDQRSDQQWQQERYFWCLMSGHFDRDTDEKDQEGGTSAKSGHGSGTGKGQGRHTGKGRIRTECSMAYVRVETNRRTGQGNTKLMDVYKCEGQWNNNSFAVHKDGVFFVTNGSQKNGFKSYMWKLQYHEGKINLVWQTEYKNCGVWKQGQKNIGSGTTPTVFDEGKLVAITDNNNPYLNVSVFSTKSGKLVSETPVFNKMRGACDASLIGVDKYIVVQNNYGHTEQRNVQSQYVANEPGMTMIKMSEEEGGSSSDGGKDGKDRSEVMWEDKNYRYLAMANMARESGVIYCTMMDHSGPESSRYGPMYYMCAKDTYDGRVIWRIPMGRGYKFCHNYGGIYFNRRGDRIYVGTNEYLICIRNA